MAPVLPLAMVLPAAILVLLAATGCALLDTESNGGDDAMPTGGKGSFVAAAGQSRIIGSGRTLVRYRVEVESGIRWGQVPAWQPADFAAVVDQILGAPQGWTRSAKAPVTEPAMGLRRRSWSFQRIGGDGYDVRIRLATPKTVDRLCGEAGLDTQGVYSCRIGPTIMVNLRRWLHGAPDFQVPIESYRTNVINHEVGHYLGFGHMDCAGPGKPAPIMQTQTIALNGCRPNAYPFTASGRFVTGPHVP